MREFNVRLLPVVDKNLKLKGCVTRLDITNAVLNMQL
jgi:CBS domain-containing protein